MARTIGSGESITVGTGLIPATTQFTIFAVVRIPAFSATQAAFGMASAAGQTSLRATSTGGISAQVNGGNNTWSAGLTVPAGQWAFIALCKPIAGNGAQYRCVYNYSTRTAVTEAASTTRVGTADAITSARLGSASDGTLPLLGDVAAVGIFSRVFASEAELPRYAFSLDSWLSLGSGAMWVLDQASTTVPVLDWTGGGANQTAISGTSVATTSAPIGYGHPVILSTRSSGAEHLFRNQTPVITNASDGTPGITTATTFRAAVAGQVTAARFFATTTVSGAYTVGLWSVDSSDPGGGTLLASKTMGGAPNPGTWNTVTFDSPVSVVANTAYRVGVFSSAGRYVATTGFFTGADLVNGNLTADQPGDTIGAVTISQGTFRIDSVFGYPNTSGSGSSYFVDVDFYAGAPAGVTGTVAATLPALTASAAGTVPVTATAAVSLPPVAAAATGTASTTGTAAAALPAVTASATGAATVSGTAAATLPALSAAASGTASASGTATVALPALTAAATGTAGVTATSTATLPALAASAAGTANASSTAAAVLPAVQAAVVGDVAGATSGGIAATLPALTAAASGTAAATGTVAAALPALGATAAGTATATGTLATALPALTATITGATDTITGTVNAALPALQTAAVGTPIATGLVAVTLPALVAAANGSSPIDGTIAVTLPALVVNGTDTPIYTRRPGILAVGTIRSTVRAGTMRGPTMAGG